MQPAILAGIETGGTKLQIGIARCASPNQIERLFRCKIARGEGAKGILRQIEYGMRELDVAGQLAAIGFGFGGPVNLATGCAITSHQVAGWDNFPLTQWCRERWPVPIAIGNDCNVAALAEARSGAGQGVRRMLYCTVGTGVGGGMVIDGRVDGNDRPAAAELGHLRPGLDAVDDTATVESIASGLAIEQAAASAIADPARWQTSADTARALASWSHQGTLTTREIAAAAAAGNPLAERLFERAAQALGWSLAQATTLLAPERIVIGGGVAAAGPQFLAAIGAHWRTYCFPPLRKSCELRPAALGEQVVICGALTIAHEAWQTTTDALER